MSVVIGALVLLTLIWVGYPVVVLILALVRRRPRVRWQGDLPLVSVIIATRDGPHLVRSRLANLETSRYPLDRLEVVVGIDPNARDLGDFSLPDTLIRTRLVHGLPPGGKAASLNTAVESARGTILVFADAAQQFAPDTIGELTAALGDRRVGAASGRLEIERAGGERTLAELYWLLERGLRNAEGQLHSAVGVTGAVYAMRRELFAPLPPGLILDDLYVPMRLVLAGYRVAYCDSAIALEPRRFGVTDEHRRKVRTLTGVIQLCRLLPEVLIPWRNPIWIQFICHKLLRFVSPVLVTLIVVGFGAVAIEVIAQAPEPGTATTRLALALLGGLALLAVPRLRRAFAEFIYLHVAIVRATVNGIRSNWQVW